MIINSHNEDAGHVTLELEPGEVMSAWNLERFFDENGIPWNRVPLYPGIKIVKVDYQEKHCYVYIEYGLSIECW